MRMKYFGDSYDVVKRSFLLWLSGLGPWSAEPMFTDRESADEAPAYERLLGCPLVSTNVLTRESNRERFFAPAMAAGNLFLDPNTGLRAETLHDARAPNYVFLQEIARFIQQRPSKLTLVFDQSLSRGNQLDALAVKGRLVASLGFAGFVYSSHACLWVFSGDRGILQEAKSKLILDSGLPEDRIISPGETSLARRGASSQKESHE